jgi:hypothetical protein
MNRAELYRFGLAVLSVAGLALGCSRSNAHEAQATSTTSPAEPRSGGEVRAINGAETGVGWSIAPKTEVAVTEALQHAELHTRSDLVVVLYTAQHSSEAVLAAVLAKQGTSQRIIGMSSHEGVITSEGYHSSPDGVVGALSIHDPGVIIGVGGASFDEAAGGESARLAFRRAAADAGRTPADKPTMVLLFGSRTTEEDMLAALTQEIGPDVPLVGGTAAGRAADIKQKRDALGWSLIANNRRMPTGASVAAFYSRQPFVYSYGGGFMPDTSVHGVVTDADKRVIRAIDGQPAFAVYDRWEDGRAQEARARGEKSLQQPSAWLVKHMTDHGILHDQFVHAFFRDDSPDYLFTDANVKNGDVLYRTQGTWDILLNRFASMPREAREASNVTPAAGLFFYCAGALNAIPASQRGAISFLVSRSMGDMPWLGVFSWGEQGHVQGIGNLHGNLMSSALLFPTDGSNVR